MTIRPLTPWLTAAAMLALPALALSAGGGKSVWDGVYTQAQAERGGAQYQQHCAMCHGDALGGGDSAPPLTGDGFLGNWIGQDAGALFTRIKTTMPLDNPDSLSPDAVADIEAFILSRNEFPAGQADLPSDPSLLGGVTITQEKPAP